MFPAHAVQGAAVHHDRRAGHRIVAALGTVEFSAQTALRGVRNAGAQGHELFGHLTGEGRQQAVVFSANQHEGARQGCGALPRLVALTNRQQQARQR